MIIYVVFVCEEILTVHLILTFSYIYCSYVDKYSSFEDQGEVPFMILGIYAICFSNLEFLRESHNNISRAACSPRTAGCPCLI